MSKIANTILRGNQRTYTHDESSAQLDRHLRNNPVPFRGGQMREAIAKALYSGKSNPAIYKMFSQAIRRDAGL